MMQCPRSKNWQSQKPRYSTSALASSSLRISNAVCFVQLQITTFNIVKQRKEALFLPMKCTPKGVYKLSCLLSIAVKIFSVASLPGPVYFWGTCWPAHAWHLYQPIAAWCSQPIASSTGTYIFKNPSIQLSCRSSKTQSTYPFRSLRILNGNVTWLGLAVIAVRKPLFLAPVPLPFPSGLNCLTRDSCPIPPLSALI